MSRTSLSKALIALELGSVVEARGGSAPARGPSKHSSESEAADRNFHLAIALHDVAGARTAIRAHLDRVARTLSRG